MTNNKLTGLGANHPANGPLTIERLHQLRDAFLRTLQYSNGGRMDYIIADAVKAIDELLEARMAEPMACGWKHQPLYTAPPAPVEPIWRATKYPVSRPLPGSKLIVWDEAGRFVGYGSAVDTRDSGVAIQMRDGRRFDSNHDLRWQYALQPAPVQMRHLIRQRHAEWSDATFGNVGPVGPLKHLSKEALEAADDVIDLSE